MPFRRTGHAVLNADDPLVVPMAKQIRRSRCVLLALGREPLSG